MFRFFTAILLMLGMSGVMAQDRLHIDISGVGASQIPVVIAGFSGDTAGNAAVTSIIKNDLARSGAFRLINADRVMSEDSTVNSKEWREKGADALVTGSVHRLADGRIEVRYRLLNLVNDKSLSALALTSRANMTRVSAHKIADDIYEKLTGLKGIFATRIAYVTKVGKEYRLEVADADGDNRQIALRSREPIISPAWSPDGTKVAYVSFEAKKPVVYIQDLVTRSRRVIANYKGSNSAPSWSPDGRRLAVALSRGAGLTQIYTINADGTGLRKITNTQSINTEPRFSADGRSIYFTSDRSGAPQIYRASLDGEGVQRVTFRGGYNISPRVSPDGKHLAFISRRDGGFQLYVMDLSNGQELRLSDTNRDESPSFAPNGQYIMYATGRGALSVVSIDGRVRQRVSMPSSDIREPAWGPFMP